MTDQIKPADENLLRMDAYYYGFDATGVESVDIILSAIAHAGKAFHHTEDWNNECGERGDERIKGKSAVDWIQNAAEDAAFTVKDLIARIDALKAQVAAQEQSHKDILQSVGEEATRQIAELTKDQEDWRKGVGFISACLGLDTLSTVDLGERALEIRAANEEKDKRIAELEAATSGGAM